jgi:hypothetical protein
MKLVLFGIHNMALGLYLAAFNRIIASVMSGTRRVGLLGPEFSPLQKVF